MRKGTSAGCCLAASEESATMNLIEHPLAAGSSAQRKEEEEAAAAAALALEENSSRVPYPNAATHFFCDRRAKRMSDDVMVEVIISHLSSLISQLTHIMLQRLHAVVITCPR